MVLTAERLVDATAAFASDSIAVVGPPALPSSVFAAVRQEARERRTRHSWPLHTSDGRSRVPEQTVRAELGPAAHVAIASCLDEIRRVTRRDLHPSWAASCYTYYDHPGAWLSRHQDHPDRCPVAALLGVESSWTGDDPPDGNQLWLYPSPSALAPDVRITTRPNRMVLLDGRRRPHARPPIRFDERVTVLCLCLVELRG